MINTLRHRPLVLLLVGGGLLRLTIAWAPFEWLLQYVLSDDAFYYFTIARNAAHGYGLTFDRIAATNGFHPLWLFVILPFQLLIDDPIAVVHSILSVSAIVDTITICLLWRLLENQGVRQRIRIFVCSVYAFSPILFSHAGPLSGLETALNLMLTTLYLIQFMRIQETGFLSLRRALFFGFSTAMLFLARTDNIVLLTFTYFYLVIHFRKQIYVQLRLALSGVVFCSVVAPWLLWLHGKFGSIIQVSGLSIAFVARTTVDLQGWGFVEYFEQVARNIAGIMTFFPLYLYDTPIISFVPISSAILLGAFCLGAVWFVWCADKRKRCEHLDRFGALLPLVLAVVGYVTVHTLRGVYLRAWYYTALLPMLFLILAVALEILSIATQADPRFRTRYFRIAAMLVILTWYGEATRRVFTKTVGENDKYRMVNAINSLLPENTAIGSWNAGIYGYFFDRGTVVNLDGLVNNIAYEQIRNRSLEEYCMRVGITHLVDPVGSLRFWQDYWRLEPGELFMRGQIVFSLAGRTKQDSIVLMQLAHNTEPVLR